MFACSEAWKPGSLVEAETNTTILIINKKIVNAVTIWLIEGKYFVYNNFWMYGGALVSALFGFSVHNTLG